MLGAGGSIQGMINSLKANKALLKRNTKFTRKQKYFDYKLEYLKASEGIVELKKASPEQLKQIRRKLFKQRKERRRKFIIGYVISIPIVVLVFFSCYKVISELNQVSPYLIKETSAIELAKQKTDKFNFYMTDGESWLKKNKWHNATFQYKRAVELFPNNFNANYKLAIAYSYQCKYEGRNCIEGKSYFIKILEEFSQHDDYYKITKLNKYWK